MLVPATLVKDFAKPATQRTTQQVALDNINRMKEQFAAGDGAEGKRNFKVIGDRVAFTVRVNNTALVLGTYEDGGVTSDVREMAVPVANLTDALDYLAEKVKAGEYTAQLEALAGKREARTDKMRTTRAAKKEGENKAA